MKNLTIDFDLRPTSSEVLTNLLLVPVKLFRSNLFFISR